MNQQGTENQSGEKYLQASGAGMLLTLGYLSALMLQCIENRSSSWQPDAL